MSLPREPANISDLERDAERYRQLVKMLRITRQQLDKLEAENPDIDLILDRLLPHLTEALGAEHAFAAKLRQEAKGDQYFSITHAYPAHELRGTPIPWNAWLEDLVRTGRAFSRVPLEPEAQDLVPGLELFSARSALVVHMQGLRNARIVGICNEKDAMAGPFLASDCRVLDTIIQLVAVGLRVGERRSQELEGIQETSAAISAELQLDRLLDLIAERAARVFRAPATSLMLWDGSDSLVIRAAHHLSDQYRQQVRIPRAKAEQRRKADGTYAVEVIDLSREPLADPELVAAEGLHQVLSAPLWFAGELIGALNIYSKSVSQRSSRVFTHHQIELAQIFAGQAAIAVHNAGLYRASQQQTLRWKALHEASKAIVEGFATNRRELLDRIVEQAVRCIGVDGPKARLAFLQIYDPKRSLLSFECIFPPTLRASLTAQAGQERILNRDQSPDDRIGISGRVALTGQSCLVPDVRRDPDYLEVDPTTRSELDVPLLDRDNVSGVLSIESDQPNAFDENDRTTLEGLAAMAVIAIRNSEQYIALETARRELEAARERDMTDLAHTLFHRIRNAVGDIPYHLDTIRERAATASDIGEPIRHVKDRVRSLKALSEALRTLVDETGDFVEVVEVLEFLEETVRRTVEHRSVEWQIKAPQEAVRLYGNRALLADAVQSVVENACEAMDWRGSLTLCITRPVANRIELRISDTGPGIPFEIQDRIFELGYTTKDDPYREHGRGLFTCKIIVQKHRGAITFDSQPGQGTTFMITLPAPDDQSIAAEGRSDHGTAGLPASFE